MNANASFPPWVTEAMLIGVGGVTTTGTASPFRTLRWKCWNRTGANLEIGGVYMLDMTWSQAETTNLSWLDPASCWRNIVAIGTHTTGSGTAQTPLISTGIYCVATAVAADNTETEMVFASPSINVLTIAAITLSWYPRWSGLTGVAAGVTSATIGAGNGLYNRQIGRTLVGTQDGSTTVGALRSCMFYGFGMN